MPTELFGQLRADGLRFDVALSRFNELYGERLLAGALDCLRRHGASDDAIRIVRVPGAFELPQIVKRLAEARDADAVIALGVVIRGETPHFDHISAAVVRGLSGVAETTGVPVSLGVLTCDTPEQVAARSGSKAGNKGWEAALAAIEMAQLWRSLAGGGKGARRGR